VFTTEQARSALDATVYTTEGEKIGKVGQIYLDDETNEPEWVTVATGLFGTRESFVPLADARLEGDRLVIPYDKDKIKDAPQIDADAGQISREEEGQLYRHYGKDYSDDRPAPGRPEGGLATGGADRDSTGDSTGADTDRAGTSIDTDSDLTSGRDSDRDSGRDSDRAPEGTLDRDTSGSTDEALRRAEDQLNAGVSGPGGRVRLRKYIVTEEQTITVPVLREEVRVEREPDTGTGTDSESIDVRGERSTTERTT
jgi:sporulation protein YlmC with PRC-barrel domain